MMMSVQTAVDRITWLGRMLWVCKSTDDITTSPTQVHINVHTLSIHTHSHINVHTLSIHTHSHIYVSWRHYPVYPWILHLAATTFRWIIFQQIIFSTLNQEKYVLLCLLIWQYNYQYATAILIWILFFTNKHRSLRVYTMQTRQFWSGVKRLHYTTKRYLNLWINHVIKDMQNRGALLNTPLRNPVLH